jgi:hypothetical protein
MWDQIKAMLNAVGVGYAGALIYMGLVILVFYIKITWERRKK